MLSALVLVLPLLRVSTVSITIRRSFSTLLRYYQFGSILTMIEKRHPEWPLIQVSQTTMVLNMATKQFRDDVKNGKIKHSGNQLLTMAFNNAYTKVDNNGMRIDKNKNSNKIDPADAGLNAYAVCFLNGSPNVKFYIISETPTGPF